jgi:tRNA A-37 threonylcarbamoyl transferase component Bud32
MNARGTGALASQTPHVRFAGSSEQRYEIVRKIASGGMATVYLGRGVGALGFERPVAIKACHPHLLDAGPLGRAQRTEAVLDEARIAARIRHPNVVATLDVALHEGSVMIVMEYVEGLTVAALIKAAARADQRVPVAIALRVVEDALAGLHAAHELTGDDGRALGVVHRDVSPQNVLVGVDGFAKLADFGVFKGDTRNARVTASGEVKGKLGYVAPEIYTGEPASRQSDIYAMGVVLWELLAGRRLFDEAADAATMHRVLTGAVPPLSSVRDDVPIEVDAVLARALALDPAMRHATAEDLSRALEQLEVKAASARIVAKYVREASAEMAVAEGDSRSVEVVSVGASLAPTARDDHGLTPSDYVTPVHAKRARTRAGSIAVAAACVALAAGLAGTVAFRSTRSASVSAAAADGVLAASPMTAAAAAAASAAAVASVVPVVPLAVSASAPPARRERPRVPQTAVTAPVAPRAAHAPSVARPVSSAPSLGAGPAYDPAEL